jgi:hypothetical protein
MPQGALLADADGATLLRLPPPDSGGDAPGLAAVTRCVPPGRAARRRTHNDPTSVTMAWLSEVYLRAQATAVG